MQIRWFELCRELTVDPLGYVNATGLGLDSVGVSNDFPTEVPLQGAVCITTQYHELVDAPIPKLYLSILSPNMFCIHRDEFTLSPFTIADPESFREGSDGKMILGIPVQFLAQQVGVYTLKLALKEEEPSPLTVALLVRRNPL